MGICCVMVLAVRDARLGGFFSVSSGGCVASRITLSTKLPATWLINFEIDLHSFETASSSLFPKPLHSGNVGETALNRVF